MSFEAPLYGQSVVVEAVDYILVRVQQEGSGCGAWLESEFVVLWSDARGGYLEFDV